MGIRWRWPKKITVSVKKTVVKHKPIRLFRLGARVQLVRGPNGASNRKFFVVEVGTNPETQQPVYGIAPKRWQEPVLYASLYGSENPVAYQIIREWKEPREPRSILAPEEKRERAAPKPKPPQGGWMKVPSKYTMIK